MTRNLIAATVDIRSNLQTVEGGSKIQQDLGQIIGSYIGTAIIIAAIATFLYLLIGGIRWVTAGGDKGKIEKAQQTITQALIGLALVAASYAFMGVIQYFFGIDILAN